MNALLGTYRQGRIILDSKPDWLDGQRVAILPHLDGEPIGTESPRAELPDGRVVPFDGSPEHFKLLKGQMNRHNSVGFMQDKEAAFFSALREVNRRYVDALRKLAD